MDTSSSSTALTAASAPFGFAGEPFLSEALPNYPWERFCLTLGLLAAIVFWLVLFPHLTETYLYKNERSTTGIPSSVDTTSVTNGRSEHSSNEKKTKNGDHETRNDVTANAAAPLVDEEEAVPIHLEVLVLSAVLCMASVTAMIVLLSSNNTYVARRIFQAPLLTREECQYLVDMAHRVGDHNYQQALLEQETHEQGNSTTTTSTNSTMQDFLKRPVGWHKTRHNLYPTTDLNLVNDPFTESDRAYIQQKLDARLAPLLERIYGVSRTSIRANDMFVVRYDAKDRPSLDTHTDDGDISINILLNDDFEGGGTRFWNRIPQKPFVHVQPNAVGQLVTHSAQVHHEGMAVSSGTRYILVGFLAVDRVNPVSQESTSLSWFASYFSLPYLHNKCKEGYSASWEREQNGLTHRWTDNVYIKAMFRDLVFFLEWMGDVQSEHEHVNLVEDGGKRRSYLDALDGDYRQRGENQPSGSWFHGQQLNLDFDGSIASKWKTRRKEL